MKRLIPALLALLIAVLACGAPMPATPTPVDRYSLLPEHKYTPAEDFWPPETATGWSQPIPLPAPVSTSGGEDSPLITPDGETMYFFFTPDVSIPAERQILDGVTGIWVSERSGDAWSEPQRIWLEGRTETALDGCEFVFGEVMWFCSIRSGNHREIDFYSATYKNGRWTDWKNLGEPINQEYQVGEMHITADGQALYFASKRPGGYGGSDLWVSEKTVDGWGEPVNLGPAVNTSADENRPYVSLEGKDLWFDAPSRKGSPGPAIFHSRRQSDGTWEPPEEIVSSFAGEPTLTEDGLTLYFIHHYYSEDMSRMIEADIYVTRRTSP